MPKRCGLECKFCKAGRATGFKHDESCPINLPGEWKEHMNPWFSGVLGNWIAGFDPKKDSHLTANSMGQRWREKFPDWAEHIDFELEFG